MSATWQPLSVVSLSNYSLTLLHHTDKSQNILRPVFLGEKMNTTRFELATKNPRISTGIICLDLTNLARLRLRLRLRIQLGILHTAS